MKTIKIIILLMFFGMGTVFSQVSEVRGVVKDSTGETLPGVNVLVKGTNNGTQTDFDGNYTIEVDKGNILIFSFIGMNSKEVTVSSKTHNVVLSEDSKTLDEVVVVGYGTRKKSDLVGSVSSINLKEAAAVPTTNVSEMLRGRATGVQVNLNDARPGGTSNILIRGKVSLVGNDPLIIVDGVPFDNINDVPADDIANIEVLKDASSQAIYGARAANGVILITTKKGESGKIKVNYHGYTSIQTLTKNFDLYSGEEFITLRREANRDFKTNDYADDKTIFNDFEQNAIANKNYTDWEKLILKNSTLQSHSINISGGSESTKVYSSIGYFDQDGLIPGSGFTKTNLKLNVDQKITDKFSVQAKVGYQTNTLNRESSSLGFITLSPLATPFDAAGNLIQKPLGENSNTINPLWNIRESSDETKTNLTDINLIGTYQILPSLSYRLNTFLRNRNYERKIYRTRLHSEGDEGVNGVGVIKDGNFKEFLIENIINYTPEISDNHNLDFTFVQSINERKDNKNSIRSTGYINDNLGVDGTPTVIDLPKRDISRRRLVSFLGRARYGLMNKYLFTVSARADASSVFAEDNKWGFFPAAAFAWKIHNEDFLKDSETINSLKFRISYGSTGNEGINSNESLGVAKDAPYIFGGATTAGFAASTRLPNPNLKWETTKTFNVGLDFGLWNNVVTGTVEFYKANTVDFLLDRFLKGSSGYSVTRYNIGEVQNKGLEASLNFNVIRKEDFSWSIGTSFSTNKNEVVSLTDEFDEDGKPLDLTYTGGRLSVGQSINNIYQPEFDGIWQESDRDILTTPNDKGGLADMKSLPGDVKLVDQNGDGKITQEDNVYVSRDPKWFGSINTTVKYKGFELFADFYLAQGAKKYNPYMTKGGPLKGTVNGIKIPYYTVENPSTSHPKPRTDTASGLYSYGIRDASYSRLRTVTLGYNIDKDVLDSVGISNLKLYVTGTNLLTFTDYESYSPENNPGAFPDSKGFTFGVKVGF